MNSSSVEIGGAGRYMLTLSHLYAMLFSTNVTRHCAVVATFVCIIGLQTFHLKKTLAKSQQDGCTVSPSRASKHNN